LGTPDLCSNAVSEWCSFQQCCWTSTYDCSFKLFGKLIFRSGEVFENIYRCWLFGDQLVPLDNQWCLVKCPSTYHNTLLLAIDFVSGQAIVSLRSFLLKLLKPERRYYNFKMKTFSQPVERTLVYRCQMWDSIRAVRPIPMTEPRLGPARAKGTRPSISLVNFNFNGPLWHYRNILHTFLSLILPVEFYTFFSSNGFVSLWGCSLPLRHSQWLSNTVTGPQNVTEGNLVQAKEILGRTR
jgi:hypothetical protein